MAREQFQTLTEPMYYILLALTEECCGVDIMEKVKEISKGRVLVGPGTLYAMLAKFEEAVSEFGTVDKKPTLDGKQMTMFVSPVKQAK